MGIAKKVFGTTKDGKQVTSYTLTNKNGMEAEFIDYGAILVKLWVPDKNGKKTDVVLGYDTVAEYEKTTTYYGGFIGRCANRIGKAVFTLNGTNYELDKNNNGNCLHGGENGYNNMMYEVETFEEEEGPVIEFSRLSPDMEQGFPGNLDVTVTYTLTHENELIIEYLAVPDKDTPVNLTNHAYFNLTGHDSGTILSHKVRLDADGFTPTDAQLIPTGEIAKVEGTPMDFRTAKTLGQDIDADYEPLVFAGGYDHNYVLNTTGDGIELIGELIDEASGRKMEIYTDLPGVQLYAGNFITGSAKGGGDYVKRAGVCFETQHFPDAVNHENFPSPIVKAGEKFDSTTIYRFIW